MELTWTHEARELRRQRVACERDVVTSLLAFRKDAPACVSELEGLEKSGDADRSKERAALFHQCDRLKGMRNQLRSLITSAAQPASLNKLRLLVTTLETALTAFRDSQRRTYEALRRDEMEITGQLSEFEQLAQGWSSESLAALDKRLGAPVVVPPSLPPRRPRSASAGAVNRLLQQPGVGAVPPVPPTGSQDAADDAEAARRAALLRSKEKLERERKQAALELYRKQKQLEELREQEEHMKRKLAEHAAHFQEAERQAKKKAAVEQYRRERELLAARQREVSAVLAERERHAGIDEAARDRAEYHIQLAAEKRKAIEQAAGTGRSERLLMAADRARKLSAVLKPEQSEAVAQRLYGSVTASQQSRQAAEHAERAHAAAARHGAHDDLVPSSAGADRSKGISYTFGTGTTRAVPSWRGRPA